MPTCGCGVYRPRKRWNDRDYPTMEKFLCAHSGEAPPNRSTISAGDFRFEASYTAASPRAAALSHYVALCGGHSYSIDPILGGWFVVADADPANFDRYTPRQVFYFRIIAQVYEDHIGDYSNT